MLTSMDGLVKALTSRPITPIYKVGTVAKAAGSFQSLWRTAGFPTAGNIPASGDGEIPTKNTVGALNFTNAIVRSEERRVGKECASMCRSRWSPYH